MYDNKRQNVIYVGHEQRPSSTVTLCRHFKDVAAIAGTGVSNGADI